MSDGKPPKGERRRVTDGDDSIVEKLRGENDQLRAQLAALLLPEPPQGHTTLYVGAVIWLSALAVISIVTLAIMRPDNTTLGTTVLGFILPITTAFMAAALQQIHTAVNGRLSQLLSLTAKSSLAEGRLQGRQN